MTKARRNAKPATNREKFMRYAHECLDDYNNWDTETFAKYVSDPNYRWNNVFTWLVYFAQENGFFARTDLIEMDARTGLIEIDSYVQWLNETPAEQKKGEKENNDKGENT